MPSARSPETRADRHKDNETSRDGGEVERGEGDVGHNRDARDEMD